MMKKNYGAALVLLTVLAGCNGWPKAIELEQARHKPEKYQTYANTPAEAAQTISFDNRSWMVEPASVELHAAKLQSVGTANGVTLYAQQGAQSPYNVLYAPAKAGGTMYNAVVPIE